MDKQNCNRCRKEKPIDQFNIARGGGRQKNCQLCLTRIKELRDLKKCKHGKKTCKECKIGVCEHGKVKYRCKECNGVSLCEHGKEKYHCKDCGGKGICEHDRQRHCCTICKGTSICEHGRRRHQCKDCNGTSICEHGKVKNICKKCRGSGQEYANTKGGVPTVLTVMEDTYANIINVDIIVKGVEEKVCANMG